MKIYIASFLSVAVFPPSATVAQPDALQAMPTSGAVAFSGSCCYGERGAESASGDILYLVDGSSPGISCDYGGDFSTTQPGDCPSYAYACPTDGDSFCGTGDTGSEQNPIAFDMSGSDQEAVQALKGVDESGASVSSTIAGVFFAGVAVILL